MFVMPFAIINDITGEWPLGEKACKIWIRYIKEEITIDSDSLLIRVFGLTIYHVQIQFNPFKPLIPL